VPPRGWKKKLIGDATDPDGLVAWSRRHVEHLRVRGYSARGLRGRESALGLFTEWCFYRSITRPTEISKPILERYQKHLFYYRQKSGKPLSFSAQRARLEALKVFFRWLARENVILANPASELEMPRIPRALPKAIFSEAEVERVLATADTTDALGLRDRTMMEVLYSTGLRRFELLGLQFFDVDHERGTVVVRQGKGRRDRVVPIGERALTWVRRYLDDVRPQFVVAPDDGVLFLSESGGRIDDAQLTHWLRKYIIESGVPKKGAVHIFRHTMATLMLEGGADVRVIQQILGHVELSTTEIYTRVSIKLAKSVHDQTHPGAKLRRRKKAEPVEAGTNVEPSESDLLDVLDAEATEEEGDA